LHDHDDASLLANNSGCSASEAVQENDVITMTCSITYSVNCRGRQSWDGSTQVTTLL